MCVSCSLQPVMSRRHQTARTLGRLKEGIGSQPLWRLWREQSAAGNKISLHANNNREERGVVQKLWCFKEQTEGYFEITTSIKYNYNQYAAIL